MNTATQRNLQVATTILEQLGGNRFKAMTGSHSFSADRDCLIFKVGKNEKGITGCKIVLTPMDEYDVTFYKVSNLKCDVVSEHKGVYCDMLRDLFTDETGLLTSLFS